MVRTAQAPLQVIENREQAAAMLHPLRMRLLEALREPRSASGLARLIGLPRQKVNYHLQELARHAFVELVEERRKGNCTERLYRSTARAYVISPETTAALAADPEAIQDRFSSAYLTALTAQATRDLGRLRERARKAGKRLATFSLQSEVRFTSAAARAAFAEELTQQVAALVARYHDESTTGGRRFTFIVGGYPTVSGRRRRTGSRRRPGNRGGRP
ncbi:MAG: helix-turn-helix domain-containing protein [Acidobacteriota bacterium]